MGLSVCLVNKLTITNMMIISYNNSALLLLMLLLTVIDNYHHHHHTKNMITDRTFLHFISDK